MSVVSPTTLDQLEMEVRGAQDEVVLIMGGDLRDLCGESRLKSLARDRIQENLRQRGLVALPEVPDWQENCVYITQHGSNIFRLSAALDNPSEANLEKLRGAVSGTSVVVEEQSKIAEASALAAELAEVLSNLDGNDGA